MEIKKGDKFLCIKDAVMDNGDFAYKRGEIYRSEFDECITDIQGYEDHIWEMDDEDPTTDYFKPLSEVGNIYTDATDRLRELYKGYQGDKFGDPTKAKFFGVKFSDREVLYLSANDEYENPFFNRDYVTEEVFIELTGLTDKPVIEQDEYSWVNNGLQDVFNPQPHYDNSRGSLYKLATELNLNHWEFDILKRLVRCRKKGQFKQDLQKIKDTIDIYIDEYDRNI